MITTSFQNWVFSLKGVVLALSVLVGRLPNLIAICNGTSQWATIRDEHNIRDSKPGHYVNWTSKFKCVPYENRLGDNNRRRVVMENFKDMTVDYIFVGMKILVKCENFIKIKESYLENVLKYR